MLIDALIGAVIGALLLALITLNSSRGGGLGLFHLGALLGCIGGLLLNSSGISLAVLIGLQPPM